MKKLELIALLKRGTARALARKAGSNPGDGSVPVGRRQQDGAGKDPSTDVMEAIRQISSKLDAIAQGVAMALEHFENREATPAQLSAAEQEVDKMLDEIGETKTALSDDVPVPHTAMISRRWG